MKINIFSFVKSFRCGRTKFNTHTGTYICPCRKFNGFAWGDSHLPKWINNLHIGWNDTKFVGELPWCEILSLPITKSLLTWKESTDFFHIEFFSFQTGISYYLVFFSRFISIECTVIYDIDFKWRCVNLFQLQFFSWTSTKRVRSNKFSSFQQ